MNRPALLTSLLLAAAMLAAGCGSAASQGAALASPAAPPSLATSLATATGTWAVTVMGGSAASHNNFWQLFVRPAGTSTWRLATPPGVASNGGLVLTGLASGSVLAGFRPSQDLAYSPLATTKDNGKAWSPGLLDAGLADVPGALAADPASGRLLALLTDGTTDISGQGGTRWIRLVTRQALAIIPGRNPVPAGQRHRGRVQPIRAAHAGRGLRPSRNRRDLLPDRPDVAAHRTRATRRLRPPGHHRPQAHYHRTHHHGAAWRRNRARGTPPSRLVCGRRRALDTVAAAAAERRHPDLRIVRTRQQPRHHPEPPARSGHHHRPGTVAATAATAARHRDARAGLASGGWDALAVHSTQLTIWQAVRGTQTWASAQVIKVPIPFGSSG